MIETGIMDKTNHFSTYISYKLYAKSGYVFHDREKKPKMEIDEFRIALGPHLLGITAAIIALNIEIICLVYFRI